MGLFDTIKEKIAHDKMVQERKVEARKQDEDLRAEVEGRFADNENLRFTEEGIITKAIIDEMCKVGILTNEQAINYKSLVPYKDKYSAFFLIKDIFDELDNHNYKFVDATCKPHRFNQIVGRGDDESYTDKNAGARAVCQMLGNLNDADIRYTTYNGGNDYIIIKDWQKVLARRKQAVTKMLENEKKKLADFESAHVEELELIEKIKKAKDVERQHINLSSSVRMKTSEFKGILNRVDEFLQELKK